MLLALKYILGILCLIFGFANLAAASRLDGPRHTPLESLFSGLVGIGLGIWLLQS